MNFGIKQTFKKDDMQQEILSIVASNSEKIKLYVLDTAFSVSAGATALDTAFFKGRAGWTEISFAGTFSSGSAKITLKMDGVTFFEKNVKFLSDTDNYFSYCKNLYLAVGTHSLAIVVSTSTDGFSLSDACFCLTGGGLKQVFTPEISFEKGFSGKELYVAKYTDGFYLLSEDLDRTKGKLITFEETELPQKAKIKYYSQKLYILYKAQEGVWKISLYDEQNSFVPVGVSLAIGSDCDFFFRTSQSGDVYFVSQGELYRFFVTDLFSAKSETKSQRLVFDGVSQKVRGVYVTPYDAYAEDSTTYLAVWGVNSVVTALVSAQNSVYYTTVVKILSEPNGCGVYAIDNIFLVGALKNGLLTEYRLTLTDEGVTETVSKKRYCSRDTAVAKTLNGFALYDDGKYILA